MDKREQAICKLSRYIYRSNKNANRNEIAGGYQDKKGNTIITDGILAFISSRDYTKLNGFKIASGLNSFPVKGLLEKVTNTQNLGNIAFIFGLKGCSSYYDERLELEIVKIGKFYYNKKLVKMLLNCFSLVTLYEYRSRECSLLVLQDEYKSLGLLCPLRLGEFANERISRN